MDDQILSQTDVNQGQVDLPARVRETVDFARQLELLRDERGWTKADLAKRSSLDPSSITRFEQGTRSPDRATVIQISNAMALPVVDRDRLLAAAGYRSDVWDDPRLVELSQILADKDMPDDVRDQVRSVLDMAIAYARLKRFDAR
jgi:transcriptional regulator with XRE-family HTH domain